MKGKANLEFCRQIFRRYNLLAYIIYFLIGFLEPPAMINALQSSMSAEKLSPIYNVIALKKGR